MNQFEELAINVDRFTPTARLIVENIGSKWQRKVYLALCDLLGSGNLTEISSRARMGMRHTATCLYRLRQKGLVDVENHIHHVRDIRVVAWYWAGRHLHGQIDPSLVEIPDILIGCFPKTHPEHNSSALFELEKLFGKEGKEKLETRTLVEKVIKMAKDPNLKWYNA